MLGVRVWPRVVHLFMMGPEVVLLQSGMARPGDPFPPSAWSAPIPSPESRMLAAWHDRQASDYRFDFWTALGWTLLTFGVFAYYIAYQLCRRSRDHNLRRLSLLEASNEIVWGRAVAAGRSEELRPGFERIAGHLGVLRKLTTEFRDPAIWLVIVLASSGIGLIVLYVLLDQDLVRHSAAEAAVEAELAALARTLGAPLPSLTTATPKTNHNYGGRIAALLATCGIYTYWWMFDLMSEGNRHFDENRAWEDAVVPVLAGR